MAKETRWEFTVEGSGPFPIDMLRYDACWPKTEMSDSYGIAASIERGRPTHREITLVGMKEPTIGRWHSFGWKVKESESRRIVLV